MAGRGAGGPVIQFANAILALIAPSPKKVRQSRFGAGAFLSWGNVTVAGCPRLRANA